MVGSYSYTAVLAKRGFEVRHQTVLCWEGEGRKKPRGLRDAHGRSDTLTAHDTHFTQLLQPNKTLAV